MAYIKPQSPIMNGADHVYPLTTADQVVVHAGESTERRLEQNGVLLADDSNKLGGKEPNYYIQPVNLLLNSDFRNPVMQAGFCGLHGTDVYVFDQWRQQGDGFTHDPGIGLAITPTGDYSYIYQKIEFADGEYTFATYDTNGMPASLRTCTIEAGELSRGNVIYASDGHYINPYKNTDNKLYVQIVYPAGTSGQVRAACAYESKYTLDTLPPYESKGYANELLACKVEDTGGVDADTLGGKAPEYYIQPLNLLDNSDFRNPVMQAGFCGTHGTTVYVFDRWIRSGGTYTHSSDGLTIHSLTSTSYIYQKIPWPKPGRYTLATYFPDGSPAAISVYDITDSNLNRVSLAYSSDNHYIKPMTPDDEFLSIQIACTSSTTTIRAACMYPGGYTIDNLPPYTPKGYAAELLACKVYDTDGIDADTLGGVSASEYARVEQLADEWQSSSAPFLAGNYYTYENKLWRCLVNNSVAPSEADTTNWVRCKLANEVTSVKNAQSYSKSRRYYEVDQNVSYVQFLSRPLSFLIFVQAYNPSSIVVPPGALYYGYLDIHNLSDVALSIIKPNGTTNNGLTISSVSYDGSNNVMTINWAETTSRIFTVTPIY